MLSVTKGEDRPKALLINMDSGKVYPLLYEEYVHTPTDGCFSPDGTFLVLISPGDVYCVEVGSRGLVHTWPDSEEGGMKFGMGDDNVGALYKCIKITKNNLLLTRGLGYHTKQNLYAYDLKSGEKVYTLTGHAYTISIIALNNDQTLAATATSESVVINGNSEKYAHIWDLEEGKQISVCGKDLEEHGTIFTMLNLCGTDRKEFLLSNCSDGLPIIYMWYFGTRKEPLEFAVPIYELIGHNTTIMYSHMANHDKFLVSGSSDNTVILWNIDIVFEKCDGKIDVIGLEEVAKRKLEAAQAPNKFGEGIMVTTSILVNK